MSYPGLSYSRLMYTCFKTTPVKPGLYICMRLMSVLVKADMNS